MAKRRGKSVKKKYHASVVFPLLLLLHPVAGLHHAWNRMPPVGWPPPLLPVFFMSSHQANHSSGVFLEPDAEFPAPLDLPHNTMTSYHPRKVRDRGEHERAARVGRLAVCTHFNGGVVLLDRIGEQRARARVQTACVAHGRPAIRCFNVVNIGNLVVSHPETQG